MNLEAKNISFAYKSGEPILENFNIAVAAGERVGLVAPSGGGKTTLCQILAGFLRPATGTVTFDGVDVHSIRGYCPVQLIWQHPEKAVNPRLKLKETLAEGDMVEARVLAELGIEKDWLRRYPGEVSGGELQRFCLARALGQRTKFLIADEISAMLDLITQAQIWDFLLREIAARQLGLIVVTHNPSLRQRLCTRVVDLTDDGTKSVLSPNAIDNLSSP